MDKPALAAANQTLAAFKASTAAPAANEGPAPAAGWDGKPAAPQASGAPAKPATAL
jgi:hypothetical protein